MVLSSNIDPRSYVQRAGRGGAFLSTFLRQRSDQGAAKTLGAFLDLCGRAGTADCAFSAGSAAATRAKFASLLARLGRHPPRASSYSELVSSTILGLYNSTTGWSALATELQKAWTTGASPAFHAGDGALHAGTVDAGIAARERRAGREPQVLGYRADPGDPLLREPQPAPRRVPRLGRVCLPSLRGRRPYWAWTSEPCASWPARAADRYTGPWNRRTANPILVIGNTYDPATPYQGSVAMAHQLARARLLTVDGYRPRRNQPLLEPIHEPLLHQADPAAQGRQMPPEPAAIQRMTTDRRSQPRPLRVTGCT